MDQHQAADLEGGKKKRDAVAEVTVEEAGLSKKKLRSHQRPQQQQQQSALDQNNNRAALHNETKSETNETNVPAKSPPTWSEPEKQPPSASKIAASWKTPGDHVPEHGKDSTADGTTAPVECQRVVSSVMMDDAVETTRNPLFDLETALHQVVRAGGSGDEGKEYLSNDHEVWVNFRLGHAGDVSVLATCYHQQKLDQQNESSTHENHDKRGLAKRSTSDETPLEIRLAAGLGDEDTPPSVFALVADISSNNDSQGPKLGAVALLTLAWEKNSTTSVLRVEWMYTDPTIPQADLLERRMWLRLSALSLLTSSELVLVDGE